MREKGGPRRRVERHMKHIRGIVAGKAAGLEATFAGGLAIKRHGRLRDGVGHNVAAAFRLECLASLLVPHGDRRSCEGEKKGRHRSAQNHAAGNQQTRAPTSQAKSSLVDAAAAAASSSSSPSRKPQQIERCKPGSCWTRVSLATTDVLRTEKDGSRWLLQRSNETTTTSSSSS